MAKFFGPMKCAEFTTTLIHPAGYTGTMQSQARMTCHISKVDQPSAVNHVIKIEGMDVGVTKFVRLFTVGDRSVGLVVTRYSRTRLHYHLYAWDSNQFDSPTNGIEAYANELNKYYNLEIEEMPRWYDKIAAVIDESFSTSGTGINPWFENGNTIYFVYVPVFFTELVNYTTTDTPIDQRPTPVSNFYQCLYNSFIGDSNNLQGLVHTESTYNAQGIFTQDFSFGESGSNGSFPDVAFMRILDRTGDEYNLDVSYANFRIINLSDDYNWQGYFKPTKNGTSLDGTPEDVDVPEDDDPTSSGSEGENTPDTGSGAYEGLPEANTDGGHGTYDFTDDGATLPDDPELSAFNTRFISLYNPSSEQLNKIANAFWGNNGDILTNIKLIFTNPVDSIIALRILPVNIPNKASAPINIGGHKLKDGDGEEIFVDKVVSQFTTVNMGTLELKRPYDTFADYSPYTRIEIYLPYCGTFPLDTSEIWNEKLSVVYKVDVLSGDCVAFVMINNKIHYQFPGNCAQDIPITAKNVASQGSAITAGFSGVVSTVAGIATGNPLMTIGGLTALGTSAPQVVGNSVSHGGSISTSTANISVQQPYLIISEPKIKKTKNFQNTLGFASNISGKVEDFSGRLMCKTVRGGGLTCTDVERDEIFNLLKEGVNV